LTWLHKYPIHRFKHCQNTSWGDKYSNQICAKDPASGVVLRFAAPDMAISLFHRRSYIV